MIVVLLLAAVGLPLLLTFRSLRWRRTGRIVALVGLLLTIIVLVAGILGARAVG